MNVHFVVTLRRMAVWHGSRAGQRYCPLEGQEGWRVGTHSGKITGIEWNSPFVGSGLYSEEGDKSPEETPVAAADPAGSNSSSFGTSAPMRARQLRIELLLSTVLNLLYSLLLGFQNVTSFSLSKMQSL